MRISLRCEILFSWQMEYHVTRSGDFWNIDRTLCKAFFDQYAKRKASVARLFFDPVNSLLIHRYQKDGCICRRLLP